MKVEKSFDAALPRPQRAWLERALGSVAGTVDSIAIPLGSSLELAHLARSCGFAPANMRLSSRNLSVAAACLYASGGKASELGVVFSGDL